MERRVRERAIIMKAEFVGEERFDDNESETSILVATNADIDMDVDGEG